MHPNVSTVQDALDSADARDGSGAPSRVRMLPDAVTTAAAAAAALGVEVGQIANSLVFAADGQPLLAMTSGAHRVDTAKVAALLGVSPLGRVDRRRRAAGLPEVGPDRGGRLPARPAPAVQPGYLGRPRPVLPRPGPDRHRAGARVDQGPPAPG